MRYAGSYRLIDNPKAKRSHQYRAMLKRRMALETLDRQHRAGAAKGKETRRI